MPITNRAKAPKKPTSMKRFSLVPEPAQQEMYKALAALKPIESKMSGAEVAEIAASLVLGANDTVILACSGAGARIVRSDCNEVESTSTRWESATIQAVKALFHDPAATALICAGQLDAEPKGDDGYRAAFRFAACHKLPILFLVANTLTLSRAQKLDLRTLYAEFGIPLFSVDSNDAIAAYRIATEALHNARHHRGPCVIEALTVSGKGLRPVSSLDLLRDYMERHGNPPV